MKIKQIIFGGVNGRPKIPTFAVVSVSSFLLLLGAVLFISRASAIDMGHGAVLHAKHVLNLVDYGNELTCCFVVNDEAATVTNNGSKHLVLKAIFANFPERDMALAEEASVDLPPGKSVNLYALYREHPGMYLAVQIME